MDMTMPKIWKKLEPIEKVVIMFLRLPPRDRNTARMAKNTMATPNMANL